MGKQILVNEEKLQFSLFNIDDILKELSLIKFLC